MIFGKEQREARRQLDDQIKHIESELKQLREQYAPRKKAYDAEIENYIQSVSDKWEYLEVNNLKTEGIDVFGDMGWELINVVFFDLIENNYRSIAFKYVFKRRKVAIPDIITAPFTDVRSLEQQINRLGVQLEELQRSR